MTQTKTQGFTLIEAAVAIAVVAILSGIIVPLVVKNLQDSQIARAKNDVQVIAAAVASQLKDTGGRPQAAAGPGGCSGLAQATWQSGGTAPLGGYAASNAANLFTNLFTAPTPTLTAAQGNTLFGTTVGNEFSFKGPYLGSDVAVKTDPWGTAYVILGYNQTSQTNSGPIWIACAGPDKTILAGNTTVAANVYPAVWTTTTTSADDIVVRVN